MLPRKARGLGAQADCQVRSDLVAVELGEGRVADQVGEEEGVEPSA